MMLFVGSQVEGFWASNESVCLCVPVLLTFLHKTEEQTLVLLIFFVKSGIFSVCVCDRSFRR